MRTYTAFRHRQPQWVVIRTGLPRSARSDGSCAREERGGVMHAGLPRCARSDGPYAREVGGVVPHAGLPRFARSDGPCGHRVTWGAAHLAGLSHCDRLVGSSCHREERSDVAIHDFFGGMCQDEHIQGVTAC
jgi:hypothetical protein